MCPENILYRELKNIIGPDITDQESFTRTKRYYLRNYDSALLVNNVDSQYYEAFRKLLLRHYRAGTLGDYVHQTVKNPVSYTHLWLSRRRRRHGSGLPVFLEAFFQSTPSRHP